MKFEIEDLTVYWPYERVYPEQYHYMARLKNTLDAKGNCLLEMPTGTGKTVSLLALITSYQLKWPNKVGKLIYCTRTVPEMTKAMVELKRVIRGRAEQLEKDRDRRFGGALYAKNVTAVCLSSRRNMCVHEEVLNAPRQSVDSACRERTANFVRSDQTKAKCNFFENFDREGSDFTLGATATAATAATAAASSGGASSDGAAASASAAASATASAAEGVVAPIYTLEDLQAFGRRKKWCPYFWRGTPSPTPTSSSSTTSTCWTQRCRRW